MEGDQKKPSTKKDILWLLDKADSLADGTNDAIHSPFAIVSENAATKIVPLYFFGIPRALKLKDKDLVAEFSWGFSRARALSGFALRTASALRSPHISWPDKSQLPKRQLKKATKTSTANLNQNRFVSRLY